MKRKTIKITVAVVLSVIGLLLLADIGGSFYLIDYALLPRKQIEDNYRTGFSRIREYSPEIVPWLDSLEQHHALRDTFIVNNRGLRLHAYYVRAARPTSHTAILIHGYTVCSIGMLNIGCLYNRLLHYNILLPDNEYHGRSQGSAVTMGWIDRLNILRWVGVADTLFGGHTQQVIHGISMGAATTMMVSGEQPQPSCIKCYVEDCGYTSVWDEYSHEIKVMYHLPEFPLLYSSSLLCKLRFGWSFGEASSLKQVARCTKPMLFIHGDSDTYVPSRMVIPLYKAKPQPKELWVVHGATHAQSYHIARQAYTKKVAAFVGKYIH